jgi:Peptidase A4 family
MRIERKVGAGAAVLGSLLLAVSGTVPALARSGPSAGFSQSSGLRFAEVANAASTGFGGWVFAPKGAASVTAEFRLPTLTCTSATSGTAAVAELFTGSSSSPNFNAAGVGLQCSGGTPAAAAAVVVDGTQASSTHVLHVGDLMKSTVVTSATKTTATIADLTKGHTFTFTKSGKGAASLQEQIGDIPLTSSTGKRLPVVNFGKISFSSGAVGGKALGSVSPSEAVNMQTSKKVLQIVTSALTGTKKNAFTTTWKHS